MTVNMPVEAIDPICMTCPDLDIVVTQFFAECSMASNHLECSHYQRCLKIKEALEKERDSKK